MPELIDSWPLGAVRAVIPSLRMRRQAQRSAVTLLRSHSRKVAVLTSSPCASLRRLRVICSLPFPAPILTHTRAVAAGEQGDRQGGGAKDTVSTPTQTLEAKSLPLTRRLMAAA